MQKIALIAAILLFCLLIMNDSIAVLNIDNNKNQEKIIALTFDDGPRPKILLGDDGLIAILEQYDAKATFFLIGAELANSQNRKAAEELFKKGHELENHTYSHNPLINFCKKYGEQKVRQDIKRASDLIAEITGEKPKFLRPPYWSINAEVKSIIESEGLIVCSIPMPGVKMPLTYEDVNSEDYCFGMRKAQPSAFSLGIFESAHTNKFAGSKIASHCSPEMKKYYPDNLSDYVKTLIRNREKKGIYSHILVFHELSKSKDALKILIPELQKQGYKFVRLNEYYYQVQNK